MKYLIILLTTYLLADTSIALQTIKQHEGYSQYLYKDVDSYSIGYGTHLARGLSKAEATLLLNHRLAIVEQQLLKYKWYTHLNPIRQSIIQNMTYNLGLSGLLKFKHLIWCLKTNYFNAAANNMRQSLWYKQTGNRAKYLINQMKQG
jgi:lysozyme